MKRILFVCLSALLLFGTAACGGNPAAVPSASLAATPSPEPTPTSTEITITQEYWDTNQVTTKTITRSGIYTGLLINGLPEGAGQFETANDDGDRWIYIGEFSDGKFNGQGTVTWPDPDNEISESGTYTNGLFTPTTAEFYQALGQYCRVPYILPDESLTFISDHENLFPATTSEDKASAKSLVDTNIEYKNLSKSISKYLSSLYSDIGGVVQIFENTIWGRSFSFVLTIDENYNYNLIYFGSSLPDVFEGDMISFVSLPIALTSFDNVSGGTTNAIIHIGCDYSAIDY